MLDLDSVITVHDEIIAEFIGIPGFAHGGRTGVAGALARVEAHIQYANLDDIFGIAALYAVAIAKGHVFNDGNKRTGLTCALTYLEQQGVFIPKHPEFEQAMVEIAEGELDYEAFAEILSLLWQQDRESG